MWCDEKSEVALTFSIPKGCFGIIGKGRYDPPDTTRVTEWVSCRDSFASYNHRKFMFGLDKEPSRTEAVTKFIAKFEEHLGLNKKQQTRFGPTLRPDVIWVELSSWWDVKIRRSLFTALLRCGFNYKPKTNNFRTALYSRAYTRKTRKAVEYFLLGNTSPKVATSDGWQSTFEWRTEEQIRMTLINPKGNSSVASG